MASTDRLFRDSEFGVGLERVVEGLIDGELDLCRGRRGIHVGGLGAQRRCCHQVIGAPEVGDQLRQRDSIGKALIDDRVIEVARGDAAAVVRFDGGQAAIRCGIVIGLLLARHLLRSHGQQPVDGDLRIIAQGQRLRVLNRQPHRRAGGRKLRGRRNRLSRR